MENKFLDAIWQEQSAAIPPFGSQEIIKKAIAQRLNQKIGMAVMCITVGILILYAIWQFPDEINMFIVGIFIMIASLTIRIAIEYYSKLRKISGLLKMDGKQYLAYLKSYYRWRKRIHFVITPVCFSGYLYGLWELFPYFKAEFSDGFYTYLIISASVSLTVIAVIIINQIRKELVFEKSLIDAKPR
ncbi:hypothetical protein [Nonlabens antarcticus]|uniref:hypothetical protein n=1 Tax=Nonlabens antarcticus TaxID=392714 RepID=UPI0018918907|nr:hypothetical protein [Nonlabens antarcticus]